MTKKVKKLLEELSFERLSEEPVNTVRAEMINESKKKQRLIAMLPEIDSLINNFKAREKELLQKPARDFVLAKSSIKNNDNIDNINSFMKNNPEKYAEILKDLTELQKKKENLEAARRDAKSYEENKEWDYYDHYGDKRYKGKTGGNFYKIAKEGGGIDKVKKDLQNTLKAYLKDESYYPENIQVDRNPSVPFLTSDYYLPADVKEKINKITGNYYSKVDSDIVNRITGVKNPKVYEKEEKPIQSTTQKLMSGVKRELENDDIVMSPYSANKAALNIRDMKKSAVKELENSRENIKPMPLPESYTRKDLQELFEALNLDTNKYTFGYLAEQLGFQAVKPNILESLRRR
jgi:hypothetical protein